MTQAKAQELIQKIISEHPSIKDGVLPGFYLEPILNIGLGIVPDNDKIWYLVLLVYDQDFASITSDYEKSYTTWQQVMSKLKIN